MLLFFIPEAKTASNALLEQHGLKFLDGRTTRHTLKGPSGPGLLVADKSIAAGKLSYCESQRWSPRYGVDSLVGTDPATPVTPQSLQRDNILTGESITLLDGQAWTIPLLREWRLGDTLEVEGKLPRVMQQCPVTGRFVLGAVIPKYQSIWETSLAMANQILAQLQKTAEATLDDNQIHQFAIDLLAINYRLDASVVSHLQILTPELCGQIICAALDIETLRAHLKNLLSRRTSGGTNSKSGKQPPTAAANTPTAPPPAS